jgi:hypothetical protein
MQTRFEFIQVYKNITNRYSKYNAKYLQSTQRFQHITQHA